MLIKATCTKADRTPWASGLVSSDGTSLLLNTNRINHVRVRASTKSKFLYTRNNRDRRESGAYVECNSTVASIVTAADATYNSNLLPLSYYPDQNTSNTAVTTYINVDDFALGKSDKAAPNDRSWVWYNEGAKIKKLLVAHNLDQILDEADTGTTTTSTTS